MKGTIRNSFWDIYEIRGKKEIYQKTVEKLIIEVDGEIIQKEALQRDIALEYFGKTTALFKKGNYKVKLRKIDMLKDHGRTNYEL